MLIHHDPAVGNDPPVSYEHSASDVHAAARPFNGLTGGAEGDVGRFAIRLRHEAHPTTKIPGQRHVGGTVRSEQLNGLTVCVTGRTGPGSYDQHHIRCIDPSVDGRAGTSNHPTSGRFRGVWATLRPES